MSVEFRTYGYVNDDEEAEIQEMNQVSLCFANPQAMLRFAKFVATCAQQASAEQEWDHEHFRDEQGGSDIILALLDQKNM